MMPPSKPTQTNSFRSPPAPWCHLHRIHKRLRHTQQFDLHLLRERSFWTRHAPSADSSFFFTANCAGEFSSIGGSGTSQGVGLVVHRHHQAVVDLGG